MKPSSKKIANQNLSILLGLCLALFSQACSLKQNPQSSSGSAKVTLALPERAKTSLRSSSNLNYGLSGSATGGNEQWPPADIDGFDCFVVNVTGPGINDVFGQPQSSYVPDWSGTGVAGAADSCTYPGVMSAFVGSGTTTIDLDVPVGENRLFQIVGFKLVNPSQGCPTLRTADFFRQNDQSLKELFWGALEVGRNVASVHDDVGVDVSNVYNVAKPRDVACGGDGPTGAQGGLAGGGQNGIAYFNFLAEQARFFQTPGGNPLLLNFHGNLKNVTGQPLALATSTPEQGLFVFTVGPSPVPSTSTYHASSYDLPVDSQLFLDFGSQVAIAAADLPTPAMTAQANIHIDDDSATRSVDISFPLENLGPVNGFVVSVPSSLPAGQTELSMQNFSRSDLSYQKIQGYQIMPVPGPSVMPDSLIALQDSGSSPECEFASSDQSSPMTPMPSPSPSGGLSLCRFTVYNTGDSDVSGVFNLKLQRGQDFGVYQFPFAVHSAVPAHLFYSFPQKIYLQGFLAGTSPPAIHLVNQVKSVFSPVAYGVLASFYRQISINSLDTHQNHISKDYTVSGGVGPSPCPEPSPSASASFSSAPCAADLSLSPGESLAIRTVPDLNTTKMGMFSLALQRGAALTEGLTANSIEYEVGNHVFDWALFNVDGAAVVFDFVNTSPNPIILDHFDIGGSIVQANLIAGGATFPIDTAHQKTIPPGNGGRIVFDRSTFNSSGIKDGFGGFFDFTLTYFIGSTTQPSQADTLSSVNLPPAFNVKHGDAPVYVVPAGYTNVQPISCSGYATLSFDSGSHVLTVSTTNPGVCGVNFSGSGVMPLSIQLRIL